MGIFRLSSLVNLILHPLTADFTNAAAIVIALSQLPKLWSLVICAFRKNSWALLKASNTLLISY